MYSMAAKEEHIDFVANPGHGADTIVGQLGEVCVPLVTFLLLLLLFPVILLPYHNLLLLPPL